MTPFLFVMMVLSLRLAGAVPTGLGDCFDSGTDIPTAANNYTCSEMCNVGGFDFCAPFCYTDDGNATLDDLSEDFLRDPATGLVVGQNVLRAGFSDQANCNSLQPVIDGMRTGGIDPVAYGVQNAYQLSQSFFGSPASVYSGWNSGSTLNNLYVHMNTDMDEVDLFFGGHILFHANPDDGVGFDLLLDTVRGVGSNVVAGPNNGSTTDPPELNPSSFMFTDAVWDGATLDPGFGPDFVLHIEKSSYVGDQFNPTSVSLDLYFARLGCDPVNPNCVQIGPSGSAACAWLYRFSAAPAGALLFQHTFTQADRVSLSGAGHVDCFDDYNVTAPTIQVGMDHSISNGVLFGSGAANTTAAQAVTQGIEIRIQMADLQMASAETPIGVFSCIINDGGFKSNQLMPPLSDVAPPIDPVGFMGVAMNVANATAEPDVTGDQHLFVQCTPELCPEGQDARCACSDATAMPTTSPTLSPTASPALAPLPPVLDLCALRTLLTQSGNCAIDPEDDDRPFALGSGINATLVSYRQFPSNMRLSYVQDRSSDCCLAIFSVSPSPNAGPLIGDDFFFTGGAGLGNFTEFNGALQLSGAPVDYASANLLSTTSLVRCSRITSAGLANNNPAAEALESCCIEICGEFVNNGTTFGSGSNNAAFDSNSTFNVRVDGSTDIDGTTVPSGPVLIRGVLDQFNGGSGCDGYQIKPRALTDLIPNDPSCLDTSTPTGSPTTSPSGSPTTSPSGSPTTSPSLSPTGSPTTSPSLSPTGSPTTSPSASPTTSPTATPVENQCTDRADCPDDVPCLQHDCVNNVCISWPPDCDDSDSCTTDTCDEHLGCQNDNLVCDDGMVCTHDFCDSVLGGCQHPPKACISETKCVMLSCVENATSNPQGECIPMDVSCDDDNTCTEDTCDAVLGCRNNPIDGCVPCETDGDCTDNNNQCLTGTCSQDGTCIFADVVCADEDQDPCTIEFCHPVDGCTAKPKDCQCTSVCQEPTLVPANNECECTCPAKECSSPDMCKTGHCIEAYGGCVFHPVVCDTANACQKDVCSPQTGCGVVDDSARCNDHDDCTIDSCHNVTGCVFQHIVCSDSDVCTVDKCLAYGGCDFSEAVVCTPPDECHVLRECHPILGCQYDPVPLPDASSVCFETTCIPGQGIVEVPVCVADGDSCTVVQCNATAPRGEQCIQHPLECDDHKACTLDDCRYGECFHWPIKDCCETLDDCLFKDALHTEISPVGKCVDVWCNHTSHRCERQTKDPPCCDADADCNDGLFCTGKGVERIPAPAANKPCPDRVCPTTMGRATTILEECQPTTANASCSCLWRDDETQDLFASRCIDPNFLADVELPQLTPCPMRVCTPTLFGGANIYVESDCEEHHGHCSCTYGNGTHSGIEAECAVNDNEPTVLLDVGLDHCDLDTHMCVFEERRDCSQFDDPADKCRTNVCDEARWGTCVEVDVDIDDMDLCTMDMCVPTSGAITHTPLVCDDGNACTNRECNPKTGECVLSNQQVCDDGDHCTDDKCDPHEGSCTFTQKLFPHLDDACRTIKCNATDGMPIIKEATCDDNNVCTDDSCNPLEGCVNTPKNCSGEVVLADACEVAVCDRASQDGTCEAVRKLGCCVNDQECHRPQSKCTHDFCDLNTNTCVHQRQPECCTQNKECNDNDKCTDDMCMLETGECVNDPVALVALDNCHTARCEPNRGVFQVAKDCSTGDACINSHCDVDSGDCVHEPVNCPDLDGNVCTLAQCVRGECVELMDHCDDGNPCTDDVCVNGTTTDPDAGCHYTPRMCMTDNPCVESACNRTTGVCEHRGLPFELGCCRTDAECRDDTRPCTKRWCDTQETHRCVEEPIADCCVTDHDCGARDDGCIVSAECWKPENASRTDTGTCVLEHKPCFDNNQCTEDVCQSPSGVCKYVDNSTTCNDFDECTIDKCDPTHPGGCRYWPVFCQDDFNRCTNETCDPHVGCVRLPVVCDDGDPCTLDYCDPHIGCVFEPKNCDDGLKCTHDQCNPSSGQCEHLEVTCDDHNACTEERCDEAHGKCVRRDIVCHDQNPCTHDYCNTDVGCIHDEIPCEDRDRCTEDFCHADKGCIHVRTPGCCTIAQDCDDYDVCTADICYGDVCTYRSVPQCECTDKTVPGCHSHHECDDGRDCTVDRCYQYRCIHTSTPHCHDHYANHSHPAVHEVRHSGLEAHTGEHDFHHHDFGGWQTYGHPHIPTHGHEHHHYTPNDHSTSDDDSTITDDDDETSHHRHRHHHHSDTDTSSTFKQGDYDDDDSSSSHEEEEALTTTTASTWSEAVCGNGRVEDGEACDGPSVDTFWFTCSSECEVALSSAAIILLAVALPLLVLFLLMCALLQRRTQPRRRKEQRRPVVGSAVYGRSRGYAPVISGYGNR